MRHPAGFVEDRDGNQDLLSHRPWSAGGNQRLYTLSDQVRGGERRAFWLLRACDRGCCGRVAHRFQRLRGTMRGFGKLHDGPGVAHAAAMDEKDWIGRPLG